MGAFLISLATPPHTGTTSKDSKSSSGNVCFNAAAYVVRQSVIVLLKCTETLDTVPKF
jgi:hypothetical protein